MLWLLLLGFWIWVSVNVCIHRAAKGSEHQESPPVVDGEVRQLDHQAGRPVHAAAVDLEAQLPGTLGVRAHGGISGAMTTVPDASAPS